jgi:DNA-binding transcriptional ArsR family regulator
VNDVARRLRVRQPQVSKHLKILHDVGLVRVRQVGRQRLYRLDGEGMKTIHDWVAEFEHIWNDRFDRLDAYLKELKEEDSSDEPADSV